MISTDRRNTCIETLRRGFVSERFRGRSFSRSATALNFAWLCIDESVLFWESTVAIDGWYFRLCRAAMANGVHIKGLNVGGQGELSMTRHLRPAIPSQKAI